MKHYVSITIGRNIDDKPMNDARWLAFISDTEKAIEPHIDHEGVIFYGLGQGVWGDTHEHSHAHILLADSVNEPALRADLEKLAKKYQQDAIGCAILELPNGDESLVFAK